MVPGLKSSCLALAVSAGLAGFAPAQAADRVALVVGIGNYQTLSILKNPRPDAESLAKVLRANGFEVAEHYDLNRADLLDALESFTEKAKGARLALVYYAGHGMEVAGKDIIAPIDMTVSCEPKEARRAVGLDKLFEAAAGASNQVVLLDSCRNDPFPSCPTRAARSGNGFRGLSRVDTGGSMLIANATLSGALAQDGQPGEHSPFAAALLSELKSSPTVKFRDILDRVALTVKVATSGSQVPEITARGGSPEDCLAGTGCGGGSAVAAPDDQRIATDVARLLSGMGYLDQTGDASALDGAIRKFQGEAGLTVDGQATPTLLALLSGFRLQGGFKRPEVFQGETEHPVGSTFKDCDECPEMLVLPAGRAPVGSSTGEAGREPSEAPAHEVEIARPFAVSRLEITYDQWESCALGGGCEGYNPKDSSWGRGTRPVTFVSWKDAKAYVDWLSRETGKKYRLLSEAEWEYAARGGTTTPFSTGADIATDQANFDGSQGTARKVGLYRGQTSETGSFQPNPYGLSDMHGNVAEWVEDCWNPTHKGAPGDGTPRGGDCSRRVAKGGAWYFEAAKVRSAARASYPADKRLNILGFRIARSL